MQYSDFREFLRDFYQERKPYGFSFREFSKLAGYSSPVFLKLVIEGKANLSERGTERVANATGLVGADVEYFRILVAMNQSKNAEEKKLLFEAFINPDELVQSDKRGAKVGEMETLATQAARKAINARARQNRVKDKATDLIDFRIQKEGLLDNKIIVVEIYEEDNIPQELTGLLATQFVNKYQRPCIIVRKNPQGFLRGSIRGNDSFEEVPDLKDFLESSGFTEYVQGHKNAAGISIHEKQLESLINYANFNISDKVWKVAIMLIIFLKQMKISLNLL